MPGIQWWVYRGVYAGYTMVGIHSLVYMPGIHSLGTPWYTVRGVLPGTPSPADGVYNDETLGSGLRLIWKMRRREVSLFPKV